MLKRTVICTLILFVSLSIPVSGKGAGIMQNQVRNFITDEAGSRTTGYAISNDKQTENEAAVAEGISKGAGTALTMGTATAVAAMKGAGALAGYAGAASTIASIPGAGAVTGTLGSLIAGKTVAGAAATAVCTGFVGGPIVMGGIIVGTVGAAGYGIYKGATYLKNTEAGKWATEKLDNAWNCVKSWW